MRDSRRTYWLVIVLIVSVLAGSCSTENIGIEPETGNNGNQPPATPHTPYPPDSSVGQSRYPLLTWKCEDPEGGPLRFSVQLGIKGSYVYVVSHDIVGDLFYKLPDTLDANTAYEWSISAFDTDHANPSRSEKWTFTTGTGFNNPPARPYDLLPREDLYGQRKVVCSWRCNDPDGDPLTYDVVARSSAEWVEFYDLSDTTCTMIDLVFGVPYTWKVIAHDPRGGSTESEQVTFTSLPGQPPLAPTHPFPADGATGVPIDVTLMWSCSDPDGGPLVYDVRFAESSSTYQQISTGQSDTSYALTDLEYGTTYAWEIAAEDATGLRTLGPHWTFTTVALEDYAPVAPHDPHPADGETDLPKDVTLRWSCEDPNGDPLTYDVDLGLMGGTFHRIATGLPEATLSVTDLVYDTAYDWRVSAHDTTGLQTAGPIWSFETQKDPGGQEGVFTELTVQRSIGYDGTTVSRNDYIFARFDSSYAPDGPIDPLQPAAVMCNDYDLIWQIDRYAYSNWQDPMFLTQGGRYAFDVTPGGGVPALSASVVFPSCEMYITSPESYANVSLDGFDLEWQTTTCGGTVDIMIFDTYGNPPYVTITTDNDGSYTLTGADLSTIPGELYELQIVLAYHDGEYITATGYHPQSWIRALVTSARTVTVN